MAEKSEAATNRYNELSAQIKAAETRMAEIAALRTHIVNYVKTREVYVEYREAGYSKNILQNMKLIFYFIKQQRKHLRNWA